MSPLLLCAWCCSACLMLTGCSGQKGFLAGGPSNNQLRASLSHVEVENQQLRKQVAQLKSDNRSTEDRLVREELSNGDLTARLDKARNLLKDRGVEFEDTRQASRPSRGNSFDEDDDGFGDSNSGSESRRTLPAGQKSTRKRKAPYAQIPGRIEPADDNDDDIGSTSSKRTWSSSGARGSTTTSSRKSSGKTSLDGPMSMEDQLRWTSIGDLNSKGDGVTIQR